MKLLNVLGKIFGLALAAMLVIQAIGYLLGCSISASIGFELIVLALVIALSMLCIFRQPKFQYIKCTVIYSNGSASSFIQRLDKNEQQKIPLIDENKNLITNINICHFQSRKDNLDEQR